MSAKVYPKIDVFDFAFDVNMTNSEHDRDVVFHYLQKYLQKKKIKFNIKKELRDEH